MLHCIGCGKNWYDILLGISEKGVLKSTKFVSIWNYKKHLYYKKNGDIYECSDEVKYCENCGVNLKDKDIKTGSHCVTNDPYPIHESLICGYHCSKCGYDINF